MITTIVENVEWHIKAPRGWKVGIFIVKLDVSHYIHGVPKNKRIFNVALLWS